MLILQLEGMRPGLERDRAGLRAVDARVTTVAPSSAIRTGPETSAGIHNRPPPGASNVPVNSATPRSSEASTAPEKCSGAVSRDGFWSA